MDELLDVDEKLVSVEDLTRWSQTKPHQHTFLYAQEHSEKSSPFPFNSTLNDKLILWSGELPKLRVDAVVHSTNETFTDGNPLSQQLIAAAGAGLLKEILEEVIECRTGEVKVTQGYRLPARFVLHTVGPLYNIRYQTAAESTLHNCYRNVLLKARELKLKSLGLCVINSVRRNYPPDEGAHIALRTIRRFLEQQAASGVQGLETVVLAVDNCDGGIYEVLMPLYFPRSVGEERAAVLQLPGVGGPDGEPIFPERQIRIIDNPTHHHEDESSVIDLSSQLETDSVFSQMQGDLDQQRLLGERPIPSVDPFLVREIHNKESCHGPLYRRNGRNRQNEGKFDNSHQTLDRIMQALDFHLGYERLLRRARTEDLSEVSGIGCLYQSGVDRFGRPVVVFVGKWFRFKEINLDKALLYLIYLLDPLVKGDYVIAYFHTLTGNANYPSFAWLKEVYNILPYKYKKNLKAFYVVHPTFWTKMMTWWFTTFMAPAIKQKVHSLPGVEYLYSEMSPSQLEIPAFITEYDMTINGIRYYHPGPTT